MSPPSRPDPRDSDRSRRRPARWLPVAIVLAVAVAGLTVTALGGDEDDAPSPTSTGAGPSRVITWTQAREENLDVTFADTCDPDTGRLAMPYYFAPECVADVDDNGGATSPGVTADTIKVIVYRSPEADPILDYITGAAQTDDTPEEITEATRHFVEIFQTHYQTYGRTVEIDFFDATGPSNDEVAARADAAQVASERPFAVLGGPIIAAGAWASELAANGVVCICTGGPTTQWYEEQAPYVFSIVMNVEQGQQHGIDYIGRRIAHHNATWAGDESMHDTERVFGLLYLETSAASAELVSAFEDGLAPYGADLAIAVPYTLDPARLQEQAVTAIARLKGAGVTTVIFAGDPLAPATLTAEATAQEWFPEWLFGNVSLVDATVFGRTYDQRQWAHAFGVTQTAVDLDASQLSWNRLHEWYFGEPLPINGAAATVFTGPSLLFSGIQSAGPTLTPETFRDGLFALAPDDTVTTQPFISFGEHGLWSDVDYNGIDDLAEVWWDPDAVGEDEIGREGRGMYRYVDGGARHLPGEWSDTPPAMFEVDGSVTSLDEPPPDEAVPDYPPPDRG